MSEAQTSAGPTPRKPLRVWPAVVIAILVAVGWYVVPVVVPDGMFYGVFAGLGGVAAIALWWLLFSRAAWSERVGALVLMALAVAATKALAHESIRTAAMGKLVVFLSVVPLALAFVAWAVLTRRLSDRTRRLTMVATIVLACLPWNLVKTGGFTASMKNDYMWRWSPTPEERLLAQAKDEPEPLPSAAASAAPVATPVPEAVPSKAPAAKTAVPATSPAPVVATAPAIEAPAREADWPGFRGPRRDGVLRGVRIATDWASSPPVEMWRRKIGPGWSSFAVDGDLLYTQEQRGDDELVACYRVSTGEPVWRHRDKVRFWEANAGPGPRATPTLHAGRVYTFGATGILNALDARTGAPVWSRNAATETGVAVPGWGFAGSPLVVGDRVIVAVAGTLAAYDLATGARGWVGPKRAVDYSSPQLVTIAGTPQVLLLHGKGITSVDPADGKVLWEHALPTGARILQPGLTADGDVLMTNGEYGPGNGIRRVAVTLSAGGWTSAERWETNRFKPNFNDYVLHEGHVYGFDGAILACIDLADGQRKWKGGRYGNGQLVLLADQDVLLVTGEEGDVALVRATPDQFTELGRFKALEGKSWNHPVLVRDVLLVRNGEEMAAFRMHPAAAERSAVP